MALRPITLKMPDVAESDQWYPIIVGGNGSGDWWYGATQCRWIADPHTQSQLNGTPTFNYTRDFRGVTETAQITIINVTPVNDPPVANPDVATTPEDTPPTGNVLTNDTDPGCGRPRSSVTCLRSCSGSGNHGRSGRF